MEQDPEVRDDGVLMQIHAASVNPLDAEIRDGAFKLILPYRLTHHERRCCSAVTELSHIGVDFSHFSRNMHTVSWSKSLRFCGIFDSLLGSLAPTWGAR